MQVIRTPEGANCRKAKAEFRVEADWLGHILIFESLTLAEYLVEGGADT